jgi:hypothetical protein
LILILRCIQGVADKYYCVHVFSLRAIEVWGSHENLIKELLIRDAKRKAYQQSECLIEASVIPSEC